MAKNTASQKFKEQRKPCLYCQSLTQGKCTFFLEEAKHILYHWQGNSQTGLLTVRISVILFPPQNSSTTYHPFTLPWISCSFWLEFSCCVRGIHYTLCSVECTDSDPSLSLAAAFKEHRIRRGAGECRLLRWLLPKFLRKHNEICASQTKIKK